MQALSGTDVWCANEQFNSVLELCPGKTPLGIRFRPGRVLRLIYPVQYDAYPETWAALAEAATETYGEERFLFRALEVGDDDPEFWEGRWPELVQPDDDVRSGLECAVYSTGGRWSVVVTDAHFGLLGGADELLDRLEPKLEMSFAQQERRLLDDARALFLGDQPRYLPSLLEMLHSPAEAERLIADAGFNKHVL
jgi:hypothetical protein